MDSMMIESNIRCMGRVELLYTCLANLVYEASKNEKSGLPDCLKDYADPNNRNRVIYHDSSTPQSSKLQKIIDDAVAFLPKCKEKYEHTEDYQLLQRAIEEQTKEVSEGRRIPKNKGR